MKILFVCLGNICRSPAAEGVFRCLIEEKGLTDFFECDSAGTGSWHVGQAPDPRSQAACRKAGIDISAHRARQVDIGDFYLYDLICACDSENLRDLRRLAPDDASAQVELLMRFASVPGVVNVPDPYMEGPSGFDRTVMYVRSAAEGLIERFAPKEQ